MSPLPIPEKTLYITWSQVYHLFYKILSKEQCYKIDNCDFYLRKTYESFSFYDSAIYNFLQVVLLQNLILQKDNMARLVTLQQFLTNLPVTVRSSTPGRQDVLRELTNCTVVADYVWQTVKTTYRTARQYKGVFKPNVFGYRMIGDGHNFVTVNTSDKGYVILQSYQSRWNLNDWLLWDQRINWRQTLLPGISEYNEFVEDVCNRGHTLISTDQILVNQAKKTDILAGLKSVPRSINIAGLISWTPQ